MNEQGSIGWFRERIGKFTSSKVGRLMTSGKKKDDIFGKSALSYIYEIAAERSLDDDIIEDDSLFEEYLNRVNSTSKAIRYGSDMEEDARLMASNKLGVFINEVGFEKITETFGDSSDGIIEIEGSVIPIEIKCPSPYVFKQMTMIKNADDLKEFNSDYYYQCQSHCIAYNSEKCLFIAFDIMIRPFIHIVSIERNNMVCDDIIDRINKANELIELINN